MASAGQFVNDTVIYDSYGLLRADISTSTGGFRAPDAVGFQGQEGVYTDPETISAANGTYLASASTGSSLYYDPATGSVMSRVGADGVNDYEWDTAASAGRVVSPILGKVKLAVDAAGLIPVLNVPSCLVSAGISAAEGDTTGGLLSLAGAVPLFGEAPAAIKLARDAELVAGLAKDAKIGAGAVGLVKTGESGGGGLLRLRHYTTTSGSRGIETSNIIIAKDQNKVFTELARHKALSPRDAEDKYLLKPGHGNAHVEFNADPSEVTVIQNPLSKATEHVLNGNINLEGRNPVFTRRR